MDPAHAVHVVFSMRVAHTVAKIDLRRGTIITIIIALTYVQVVLSTYCALRTKISFNFGTERNQFLYCILYWLFFRVQSSHLWIGETCGGVESRQ